MDLLNRKLQSLQEISKSQLSKILCTVPGSKYLVLEASVIRLLERVCGVKWLKGNGIEKIFKLEQSAPNFAQCPVFYMIFSKSPTFKQVVDQIRSQIDQENPAKNKFHIILVPRTLYQFEEELEALGLFHNIIKLHSFQWLPLHLDTGILSLELPSIYKSLFLDQNYNYLPTLSKALWHLFFVIGKPQFTIALGQFSNIILKQTDILTEEKGETDKIESDFGALIIIDRSVDYASALLTPGTYAALLNEVYGVKTGICEFKEDADEVKDEFVKKQPVSFHLDSNQDSVYADIKNRYFTEVTSVLSALTKQLKNEKVQSKDMALDEIKRYVQTQLQATKSRKKFITNHLLAAETIINVLGPRYETQQEIESNILKNVDKSTNFAFLEESLCSENDKLVSLRLFCLISISQKLSESEIKQFWRKFLHRFGYKYSFAYKNLISANFIQEHDATASKLRLPKFASKEFYVNANKFKQLPANPDKINLKFPTCASYVFGGSYIPLVTQIASMLLNATPLDDARTKLEGLGQVTLRNERGFPLQTRSLLVFVVGGVTYAEIAACNLLETLTSSRIVLLSDRVVTGSDLMAEMLS